MGTPGGGWNLGDELGQELVPAHVDVRTPTRRMETNPTVFEHHSSVPARRNDFRPGNRKAACTSRQRVGVALRVLLLIGSEEVEHAALPDEDDVRPHVGPLPATTDRMSVGDRSHRGLPRGRLCSEPSMSLDRRQDAHQPTRPVDGPGHNVRVTVRWPERWCCYGKLGRGHLGQIGGGSKIKRRTSSVPETRQLFISLDSSTEL